MRVKRKIKDGKFIKTYFAFLPVTIGLETRWLEKVSVLGYEHLRADGNIWFIKEKFVDVQV
jgi:hypothetical protein